MREKGGERERTSSATRTQRITSKQSPGGSNSGTEIGWGFQQQQQGRLFVFVSFFLPPPPPPPPGNNTDGAHAQVAASIHERWA